jgi:hypothetical protein
MHCGSVFAALHRGRPLRVQACSDADPGGCATRDETEGSRLVRSAIDFYLDVAREGLDNFLLDRQGKLAPYFILAGADRVVFARRFFGTYGMTVRVEKIVAGSDLAPIRLRRALVPPFDDVALIRAGARAYATSTTSSAGPHRLSPPRQLRLSCPQDFSGPL